MNRAGSIAATSIAMAIGLIASLASASGAAGAPTPKVIIEDPLNDANGVNDQGTGDGSVGDVAGADAGNASDLIEVELSNDAKNLYVTFQNEATPPATQGLGLRLRVNPDGAGGTHCLLFEAFYPGATNDLTENKAHLVDTCGGGDPIPVQILGATLIVPRSEHEALGKGAKLTGPQAQSFVWTGTYPTGAAGPYIDTTKVGSDYTFVDKKKK